MNGNALESMDRELMTRKFTKQRADLEGGNLYGVRNSHLTGINPGSIIGGYRVDDPDYLPGRQVPPPRPKLPLYARGFPTAGRSSVTQPPRAYLPSPDLRHLSRVPSSPSVYPPTLSLADDVSSICRLPSPATFADPAVPNQPDNRDANATGNSLYRVPDEPESSMIRPDSGVGGRSPDVAQQELPPDGDLRPVPPPIPPRSHLRTTVSASTIHTQREAPRSPISEHNLTNSLDDRSVRVIDHTMGRCQ